MRFIELMPIQNHDEFGEEAYVPFSRVLEKLPEAVAVPKDGGVANQPAQPKAQAEMERAQPQPSKAAGIGMGGLG